MTTNQKDPNYVKYFQACWRGDVKAVKGIVERDFDIHSCNESGYNAFEIAAKEKHIALFEFLLLQTTKKPKIKEDYLIKQMYLEGLTKGKLNIIRRMDELFKKYSIDSDIDYGLSPLMYAAYYGQLEIVKYMIARVKNPNKCKIDVLIALKKATYEKHWKVADFLLSLEVDYNIKDFDGNSYLMMLCSYEEPLPAYVTKSLKNGIKVNFKNNEGKTALMQAAGNMLKKKAENINKGDKIQDDSHIELVKLLIENKADANLKDKKGKTAFDCAVEAGNYQIAGLLDSVQKVKRNFDVNQKKIFDFKIKFEIGKPISEDFKNKWAKIVNIVKNNNQICVAILLAEIMESIDNSPCDFKCEKYYEGDIYGGADEKWELFTKNLKVGRHLEQALSESWQSIEVDVNETKLQGFKEGIGIKWDEHSDISFFMNEITLLQICQESEKRILNSAQQLFEKVGIEHLKYY